MIFDQVVIGNHPASSGYIVECFVRGNEDDSDFPSGSGRLKIEFPEFDVTGLEFVGKNALTAPTGETEESKLMEGIRALENNINLKAFFSGDIGSATGLAIKNIKNIDVYTGADANFAPDTIDFANRVVQFPVSLSSGEPFFNINVTSGDIEGRVEENLHYKVIPTDFLTSGKESAAVSGVMFSGFERFRRISGDFLISRTNGNDVFVGRGDTVEIFDGCTITIDDTIPLDFYATFRLRTTERVTLTGSGGAELQSTFNDINVNSNRMRFSEREFEEFEISCLLNEEGTEREKYLIGEL